jgi:hypothetical protein
MPVIYEGRKYDSVREFDCHIVSLKYKEGGGFMTVIPMSDRRYREEYRDPSRWNNAVWITKTKMYTTFHIVDDWNVEHVISLSNGMKREIDKAISSAKDMGLWKDAALLAAGKEGKG